MSFDGNTEPWPCLDCGALLRGATGVAHVERGGIAPAGPKAPEMGDATVCCECGAILRFGFSQFQRVKIDHVGEPLRTALLIAQAGVRAMLRSGQA